MIDRARAITRRVTALGAALLLVLTVGAGACGGGSDSSSSEDPAGSTREASTDPSPKELRTQAVAQAVALQRKISDCFERAGATVLMHADTPGFPHSSADIPGLGAFYYFTGSREDLRNSRYADVLVSPGMAFLDGSGDRSLRDPNVAGRWFKLTGHEQRAYDICVS